jgi:hypothetical protein
MIYMWFTGINYCKLAVEKDRDSIFTTITMETRLYLEQRVASLCNKVITTVQTHLDIGFTTTL